MLNLSSLLTCLGSSLSATNVGILFEILQGFLCISYGGGVRTISRYADYSERSIFRFISNKIEWQTIFVKIFKSFIYNKGHVYVLAADETVEGKSGKNTFGQGHFYSSILRNVIQSVCLFGFSLIAIETKKSYFMGFKQVIYTDKDRERIAAQKVKKAAGKGKEKGRKKGTKNTPKEEKELYETASFRAFKSFFVEIMRLLSSIIPQLQLTYLVVDSAYGNVQYLKLAKEKGLFIISKLRAAPALFFNYEGEKGKTKPRKYGEKVDIKNLSSKYLVSEKTENDLFFQTYQYQAWNKEMSEFMLNVVSIVATNTKTGKVFHTHFFSNDLQLSAENMIEYYALRFQIEFDFRETKQLFGLHKLKNYHQIQMTNMFHLAFLALLTARIWQKQWATKLQNPKLSLLDLKSIFKAQWILKNALILDKKDLSPFFNSHFIANFVPNDLINAA